MLWFEGALRRDPRVEGWFEARAGELGQIARAWFERMRACGDDVLELVHDGCPVACVGDVPFAYVNVFKAHVNVGFFLGAELDDPAGLLEGQGRRMRHVKVRPGTRPDHALANEALAHEAALLALIAAAYADVRSRLDVDTIAPKPTGE